MYTCRTALVKLPDEEESAYPVQLSAHCYVSKNIQGSVCKYTKETVLILLIRVVR